MGSVISFDLFSIGMPQYHGLDRRFEEFTQVDSFLITQVHICHTNSG
jgi:hypothetical protein